uniref:ubiquitin carboxyl-terminal hydrolase 48-like n=1 Tax=Centroberyx gerrardi TaxID=166262 RepID=UPI003AAAA7A1
MPGAYLSRPDNYGTSPVLYNGLQNHGSTCYLNSVLQVLFMTKDFREAVERHCRENPNTTNIDLQLKTLFDDLKRYTAYTWGITRTLGIDKVYEQCDAAEYLEKILSLTNPEVSKIFHGELTHRNTCCGCGTHTDAPGPFWSLPLAMMDFYIEDYSVTDGIEEFFRPSRVSGENQLYCDQCDAKADATLECKITDHPEVLMLLMKRFVFDYSYMKYVKINCVVDVPQTVQIPEFSDDTGDQSQTYELYAVVHHFGDLRGGHYIATIESQDDGRWYEFDDTRVTPLDPQYFQADMKK